MILRAGLIKLGVWFMADEMERVLQQELSL
jgi:hypothetical protein